MIYRAKDGNTYAPTSKLLINLSNTGHYEILLEGGHKVTYTNGEVFEKSLKSNPFFRRVFKLTTDKYTI